MKVKIGKYKNWVGPYQIAEKIFFWVKKDRELLGIDVLANYEKRWDYRARDWFGEFLCHGFQKKDPNNKYFEDNRKDSWFYRLCTWIHSKQRRTIKIHIDRWDTWSMDHTLALIVVPMLKQLNSKKHGAPLVDDEDVPEELRSTSAPPKENDYDIDDNHFKRWDWVMNEMIWAFEQHAKDDEEDFWIEEPEGMYFEPCEDNPTMSTMKYDKEGKFDMEAYQVHHARKTNGFRLFGKYYQSLWD